jgi:D-alanine transaminase
MPRYAYVNGRYLSHDRASVHVEDRGFQFADGVYEVVACINGRLADERGHLDRLERSLNELSIEMPVGREALRLIMREIVRRNRLKSANVYIQVTRGQAKRDFAFPLHSRPSLILTARPFRFDGQAKMKDGVKVITTRDLRWKRPDIKTIALLPQVLAKQEAAEKGAYEAWMVDDKGFITEGSSSNAWILTKKGELITRVPNHSILRGVTRTALEKLCRGLKIKLVERAFTPAEAYKAAEAFCSSAVALIAPVVAIDGKKIGTGRPGPVTMKIYEEYRAYAEGRRGEQVSWKA